MNKIIDLSKENHEPKEYKCIRRTIEFKVKEDGKGIELYGAKIISEKEGKIRL